jgi:hypothetical protein
MDDILEINFVITECGHTFHTSCLMKNAAHNGFGCPYCRAVMAELPEEEEDELEEEEENSSSVEEDDLPFSNYSLRGMRWLFARSNNEEIEEEEDENEEEEEEELPAPTSELFEQKLTEENLSIQKKIPIEDDLLSVLKDSSFNENVKIYKEKKFKNDENQRNPTLDSKIKKKKKTKKKTDS